MQIDIYSVETAVEGASGTTIVRQAGGEDSVQAIKQENARIATKGDTVTHKVTKI